MRSPEVIESVNDLIQSDRRVTVDDIARTLSLSAGTAHKIVVITLATGRSAAGGCQRCLLQSTNGGGSSCPSSVFPAMKRMVMSF